MGKQLLGKCFDYIIFWEGGKVSLYWILYLRRIQKKGQKTWSVLNTECKEVYTNRVGYITFKGKFKCDAQFEIFEWINLTDKSHKWCQEFVEKLQYRIVVARWEKNYISTNKSL